MVNYLSSIKASYRSYKWRQNALLELRQEARDLMRSLLQVKKETKIIDSQLIVSIISRLVVTSKLNIDDELISSLVSCIQTSKGTVKNYLDSFKIWKALIFLMIDLSLPFKKTSNLLKIAIFFTRISYLKS